MDHIESNEHCELAAPLELLHKWLHLVLPDASEDQHIDARLLALKVLDIFNDHAVTNGIKFLALYKVIAVGAEHMKDELKRMEAAKSPSDRVQ